MPTCSITVSRSGSWAIAECSKLLIADPPCIGSRLKFECTPKGMFLGLPVNGKTVSFTENVFYEFAQQKIWRVWSVIDKAAIEAQL